MRLISQDGTIDIPYENSMVFRDDENILYIICGSDAGKIAGRLLATYGTSEKAEKAMEMLQDKYKKYSTVTDNSSFFTMFNEPKVFRFPADEDVEE